MKYSGERVALTSKQSEEIREKLRAKGCTLKIFAGKLGIPNSTLDHFLRKRSMPLELLARIESTIIELPILPKINKPEYHYSERAVKSDVGSEQLEYPMITENSMIPYFGSQAAKKFIRHQTRQSNELNFYVPEKWNYDMDI